MPGQTKSRGSRVLVPGVLQWRAGQLPGQTRIDTSDELRGTPLQWRAGQLPGQTGPPRRPARRPPRRFNGGPGNCPAKQRWH